ncbi:cob(I)yrinic acid a,c-diamide adenosyltransferase [Candidatus Micrarchaeota archaeon]|nr:cob(I)yrinic acid a,c-diamide adenosyltransferase [Candidatus Micrarchaeota archaeon]
MPIYTRMGDTGQTVTLSGKKVYKDDAQVEAYGSVDELNALLGVAISFTSHDDVLALLRKIQKELFLIGAELAMGKTPAKKINPAHISSLEAEIDKIEEELPRLANFLVPGGSKTASLLHLSRTVCRRAERRVVTLSRKSSINPDIIKYLNRLGDLLFVLARYENRKQRIEELVWEGK